MEETQDSNRPKAQPHPVSLLAIAAFVNSITGTLCIVWAIFASRTLATDIMCLGFSLAAVSALFAILAAVRISKSAGRTRGIGFVYASLFIFATLLFSAFVVRALGTPPDPPLHILCKAHMRVIGIVFHLYADDNDGNYPTPSQWCDLTFPYIEDDRTYKCPTTRDARCSYALNTNLPAQLNAAPPNMVVLFESPPGWNQTGGPDTAVPDRHEGNGSNILFADGRVELIKAQDIPKLRWTTDDATP